MVIVGDVEEKFLKDLEGIGLMKDDGVVRRRLGEKRVKDYL
jgi:hypothetical protein